METGSGLKVNSGGKEAKNAEGPDPVLCPALPSPSLRKNRKNGNKDPTCGKTQRGPKNQGQGSVDDGPRGAAENLPGVGRRRCSKTRASENFEQEMTGSGLKTKKNRSDRMKVDLPRLNGYKSSSGESHTNISSNFSNFLSGFFEWLYCSLFIEFCQFVNPLNSAFGRPLNRRI